MACHTRAKNYEYYLGKLHKRVTATALRKMVPLKADREGLIAAHHRDCVTMVSRGQRVLFHAATHGSICTEI